MNFEAKCLNPYKVPVKVLKEYADAKLPTYGSAQAACADLYAYITFNESTMVDADGTNCIVIQPHETVKVSTGLRMAPPEGWYIQIFARSGMATKHGVAPANKTGVIDQDYRGVVIMPLHNHSDLPYTIRHGERVAQMAVVPYWQGEFEAVESLDETERADGGFGHSGK